MKVLIYEFYYVLYLSCIEIMQCIYVCPRILCKMFELYVKCLFIESQFLTIIYEKLFIFLTLFFNIFYFLESRSLFASFLLLSICIYILRYSEGRRKIKKTAKSIFFHFVLCLQFS